MLGGPGDPEALLLRRPPWSARGSTLSHGHVRDGLGRALVRGRLHAALRLLGITMPYAPTASAARHGAQVARVGDVVEG